MKQVHAVCQQMYPQPLLEAGEVGNVAAQNIYLAKLGRFAITHELAETIKTLEINQSIAEKNKHTQSNV